MHHPDLPDPPKTAARRRLIRGALSAPALMTVCSGSAFAQASNMRCLANAANAATPPAAWGTTAADADTFLRVRLYLVTTRENCDSAGDNCTEVKKCYVKGSDLGTMARSSGMPSNTQYLQINPTSYATIGSPVDLITAPPTIGSQAYVSQYVALRIDATGQIVGIGSVGQGGMVGLSCWNSVRPR